MHVNVVAVLVTTLVVFVLGWLWYSPLLFFNPWMRLRGLDPAAAMAGAKMPVGKLVIEFARCFILVYVVTRIATLHSDLSLLGSIHVGLFLWLGFPVILLTGSVIWDNVPWKVAAIHAGDWFVKLLVISIIARVWH